MSGVCPQCFKPFKRSYLGLKYALILIVQAGITLGIYFNAHYEITSRAHLNTSTSSGAFTITEGSIVAGPPVTNATVTYEPWSTPPPEVPAPPDHPPLNIVAGGFTYRIHFTTAKYLHMNDCDGYTQFNSHSIWLRAGDRNLRDTLMHELMHVAKQMADEDHVAWFGNPTGMNANHDYIAPSAPEMLSIIRQNPRLVKWLTKSAQIQVEER